MITISFNCYDNFGVGIVFKVCGLLYQAPPHLSDSTKRGLFLAHFTISFLQALILNPMILGFSKLVSLLPCPFASPGPFACSWTTSQEST